MKIIKNLMKSIIIIFVTAIVTITLGTIFFIALVVSSEMFIQLWGGTVNIQEFGKTNMNVVMRILNIIGIVIGFILSTKYWGKKW